MFYLIYGDDKTKARAQVSRIVEAARKKHAGAEFFKLTPENFSENKLDELVASQGLFYSAFIVLMDGLCEEAEIAEVLIKKIKEFNKKNKRLDLALKYYPTVDAVARDWQLKLGRNDLLVLLGAGDVFRVGEQLLNRSRK